MRKWLPNFAELIDRLSIHQIKEVKIPEYKQKYIDEMRDICHDLDLIIKEKDIEITSEMIKLIVILSQINLHIWENESNARNGNSDNNDLILTHGLNGVRNRVQNRILEIIGDEEKKEHKIDCLSSEHSKWDIKLDIL